MAASVETSICYLANKEPVVRNDGIYFYSGFQFTFVFVSLSNPTSLLCEYGSPSCVEKALLMEMMCSMHTNFYTRGGIAVKEQRCPAEDQPLCACVWSVTLHCLQAGGGWAPVGEAGASFR